MGFVKRAWLSLVIATAACRPEASSQAPVAPLAPTHPPQVDAARVRETLEDLASDARRGRYTLSRRDIEAAAHWLADAYQRAGLNPVSEDFLVEFEVVASTRTAEDLNVWVDTDRQPRALEAGDAVAVANGGGGAVIASAVVVTPSTPAKAAEAKVAIVFIDDADVGRVAARVEALRAAGARGALLVLPVGTALPDPKPYRAAISDDSMPAVLVRDEAVATFSVAGRPLAELRTASAVTELADVQISMAAAREDVMARAPNVLAYIPGSQRPDEIVVLGAHYDHIGTVDEGHFCRPRTLDDGSFDEVCNGADDNGSGTVGVLEVARAIADSNVRPKRTIVFAHFAGEELGLHGSRALADHPPDAPPFRDGHVVAMINLDMIGRLGAAGLSIGAIGSSDAWAPILTEAGAHGMDKIVYERAVSSRSDHASFYRKHVPVLFFFTGLHDDYHGPGDETDRINFDGMTRIIELVLEVTLAAADGRALPFAEPRSSKEGIVGRLPGADPDTLEPISPRPNE